MKKLLKPKEWLATGIQLMIFALLIPGISILLGAMKIATPDALNQFADSLISSIPMADPIQKVLLAYNVTDPAMSTLNYVAAIVECVTADIVTATYLGLWMNACKIIFKELIEIKGLPILQIVSGLILGALTFPMLDEFMTAIMATTFLLVLNVVLIIIVRKPGWKKWLEILIGFGTQAINAALTIAYITTVFICSRGLLTVTASILVFIVVTLVWLSLIFCKYLISDK